MFPVRPTGKFTPIPENVLLSGRGDVWERKAIDWNLGEDAARHLGFPWTSENRITPLIDGEAYMKDLYGELRKLQKPVTVLLAGWQFTSKLGLMGPSSKTLETRLLEALQGVIKKGCEVRVLAWDNIKIPTSWWDQNNRNFVDEINQAHPPKFRAAYVDANLDGTFLSHHQKEAVIYSPSVCGAYVGGIDLGVDRWDTPDHNKSRKSGTFIAWHDIQVKVHGNAALQLWANFAERWDNNSAWVIKQGERDMLSALPQLAWKSTQPGSHNVQVLRTVTPVRSGFRERTMRFGERTVICALRKAISLAECYIYIEEQFLWDCELADFIAERMQKEKRLRLIVVMAAETELPFQHGLWHYHQRSKFFMTVMGVKEKEEIVFGGKTRVYPFGLYRGDRKAVYVHSKLVIIDDRYVAVGSANFDARSMWVDTELTLGIVDSKLVDGTLNGEDAKVCEFAQDLRQRLWREHLQRPIPMLDPVASLKLFPGTNDNWPRNVAEAQKMMGGHIQCYVNVPGGTGFSTRPGRTS